MVELLFVWVFFRGVFATFCDLVDGGVWVYRLIKGAKS